MAGETFDRSRRDFLKKSAIVGIGAAAIGVSDVRPLVASEPAVVNGIPSGTRNRRRPLATSGTNSRGVRPPSEPPVPIVPVPAVVRPPRVWSSRRTAR